MATLCTICKFFHSCLVELPFFTPFIFRPFFPTFWFSAHSRNCSSIGIVIDSKTFSGSFSITWAQYLQVVNCKMIQAMGVKWHLPLPPALNLLKNGPEFLGVACVTMPRSRVLYTLPVVLWGIDIAIIKLELVIDVDILVGVQLVHFRVVRVHVRRLASTIQVVIVTQIVIVVKQIVIVARRE